MRYFIEDFIEQSNAAQSRDELFSLYSKALKNEFGYDKVVYTFITDFPDISQKAGHGIKSNYPDDWQNHYTAKGYVKIDPVIMQVVRSNIPFTWEYLRKLQCITREQLQILQEGDEAGLHEGVGVRLSGTGSGLAGVGLASSSKGINPDRNMLSKIKLLTEQFHLAYCSMGATELFEAKLSNREIEILKWWALGKSSEEVAMIIGCTLHNIKYHAQNIFSKLHANTKIFAVAKAIRLGIVSMDIIKI